MPLESIVDVLIIGAGPAGLMCANALAKAGVDVRIIDKRPTKVPAGQADGIQPRTIEVFQSYGLAERLLREGNHMHMCVFYNPGPDGRIEILKCTGRAPDVTAPTARYPFEITLHQGAIEAIFLDSMRHHGVEVERSRLPVDLEISEDDDELSSSSTFPVKVTIKRSDNLDESKTEIVRAKFVVGADGAHSWVRKALGIEMEGEQTEYVWGVVDIVPETNFPDIRNKTFLHSESGTCIVVPREGDTVRLYIQLSDAVGLSDRRFDKGNITPQNLISAAKKILHPFELTDPKEIQWWTVYIVGQRVASSYTVRNRIFIAGDACHTHSPKAGQGMNASMNDTHNLAWKLTQVLRGWSSQSLLKTYEHERRRYAQDLINFDRQWAGLVSGKPRTTENEHGVSHELFLQVFQTFGGLTSGIGVRYSPSVIVDTKHQKCAEKLVIGERIPPQVFVRAADIHPIEIQDLLPSDVRFKVLFFVGNLTETRVAELQLLAEELSKPSSFLCKYSVDGNVATVFEVITIIAGKKDNINYLLVPPFLRPHWTKVLLDDTDTTGSKGGHGHEKYGLDAQQVTVVVVRPDGYVGTIAPSTAIADLDTYFGSFLVHRGPQS